VPVPPSCCCLSPKGLGYSRYENIVGFVINPSRVGLYGATHLPPLPLKSFRQATDARKNLLEKPAAWKG